MMRVSTVLADMSLILEVTVSLFVNPLKITSELLRKVSFMYPPSENLRSSTDNDFTAKYAHSSVLQGINQTEFVQMAEKGDDYTTYFLSSCHYKLGCTKTTKIASGLAALAPLVSWSDGGVEGGVRGGGWGRGL
jgi:hypothetical protein